MNELNPSNKMTVEIWSDVLCPFCYIGKRKLEQALEKFPQADQINIVWKSFQLDPSASNTGEPYKEHLAEKKGWSEAQTQQMFEHVRSMAAGVGLEYDFDKTITANSFDAHQLLHLALKHGNQDAAKEALLRAHFTEGKNIGDLNTLISIGTDLGLDADEVRKTLENQTFAGEVALDIETARQFQITGVPYFLFDRKYAISGAQDSAVFLQTLEKAYEEKAAQ